MFEAVICLNNFYKGKHWQSSIHLVNGLFYCSLYTYILYILKIRYFVKYIISISNAKQKADFENGYKWIMDSCDLGFVFVC